MWLSENIVRRTSKQGPSSEYDHELFTVVRHTYICYNHCPTETCSQIMTNLSNAKAVWGENSEQYRTMESIAASYQNPPKSSSTAQRGEVSAKKRIEAASFGNLVYRSKPTGLENLS